MNKEQRTFRFVNEHLQLSLIETLKDVGFAYEVTDDNTVLYLPEHSIEHFIDQIVKTIFPERYYRTEILDSVKADRYRRFKQFNGTPLIEEIRDGSTYFVQDVYEKLYRNCGVPTHVSFILADRSLESDRVTELLGIAPTFACIKGEPFARPYSKRRKGAPLYPSNTGWWELCSIPHIESNDVLLHLEWLLQLLEPAMLALENLAKESTEKDLRIFQVDIVEPFEIGGISLSSHTLGQLATISDRVDIRLWPDDYL